MHARKDTAGDGVPDSLHEVITACESLISSPTNKASPGDRRIRKARQYPRRAGDESCGVWQALTALQRTHLLCPAIAGVVAHDREVPPPSAVAGEAITVVVCFWVSESCADKARDKHHTDENKL